MPSTYGLLCKHSTLFVESPLNRSLTFSPPKTAGAVNNHPLDKANGKTLPEFAVSSAVNNGSQQGNYAEEKSPFICFSKSVGAGEVWEMGRKRREKKSKYSNLELKMMSGLLPGLCLIQRQGQETSATLFY